MDTCSSSDVRAAEIYRDEFAVERGSTANAEGLFLATRPLDPSEVLFVSKHSFVIRSEKPLLPTHVLVFPKRVIGDSTELPEDEFVDLHRTCYAVGEILKRESGGEGISVFCNDIVDAGQALAHVYVNVMARKPQDMEQGDHLYDVTEVTAVCPAATGA